MASQYVGRHRAAGAGSPRSVALSGRTGVSAGATRAATPGRALRHAGVTFALSATAVAGYVLSTSAPDRIALADKAVSMDLARAATTPRATATTADVPVQVAVLDGEKAQANREANARVVAVQVAQAAAAAQLEAERQAEADRVARAAQREALLANARANPKAVAQVMVAERGWNDAQFQCLVRLWTKESNWNYTATNRSSGAYGIPQSLPGNKMASVASDWRTNPVTQITWGLNYIRSVYGTSCSAWGHSQRTNWY